MRENFINDKNYSILKYFYKNSGMTVSLFALIASFSSLFINSCYSMILRNYYKFWGYDSLAMKVPSNGTVVHFFMVFGLSFLFLFYLLFSPSIKENIDDRFLIDNAIKSLEENPKAFMTVIGDDNKIEDFINILTDLKTSTQKLITTLFLSQTMIVFFYTFVLLLSLLNFNSFFFFKEYGFSMSLALLISLCLIIKPAYYYYKINKKTINENESNEKKVYDTIELIKNYSRYSFPNSLFRNLSNKNINSICRNYFFSIFLIAGIIALFSPLVLKINNAYLVTKIDSTDYIIVAQDDNTFYLNKMYCVDAYSFISKSYHRIITTTDLSYEKKQINNVIIFTDNENLKSIISNYSKTTDSNVVNSEEPNIGYANTSAN